MKTSELIEKVKNMGFNVNNYEVALCISTEDGNKVAQVSKKIERSMTTRSFSFVRLSKDESEDLFNILVEYASTPLEERDEKKIYQFKFVNFGDRWNYLTKSRNDGQFYMDNKVQVGAYQTEFIDSEISEFPTWVYDMIEQGHLIKEEMKLND